MILNFYGNFRFLVDEIYNSAYDICLAVNSQFLLCKHDPLCLILLLFERSKGLLRFVVVCNRVGYLSRKVQICIRIDEELLKEMEKIKEETGIPISRQIELRLRGYAIVKAEDLRKAKLAPNPFELALRGTKFAKITFEEFEKASEELQDELLST